MVGFRVTGGLPLEGGSQETVIIIIIISLFSVLSEVAKFNAKNTQPAGISGKNRGLSLHSRWSFIDMFLLPL